MNEILTDLRLKCLSSICRILKLTTCTKQTIEVFSKEEGLNKEFVEQFRNRLFEQQLFIRKNALRTHEEGQRLLRFLWELVDIVYFIIEHPEPSLENVRVLLNAYHQCSLAIDYLLVGQYACFAKRIAQKFLSNQKIENQC